MNELKTKYEYGVVLENNPVDKKIAEVLDKVNDNLNKTYGHFLDLSDGDDEYIDCYVEMDYKMAYHDQDILKDIKKVCKDLGYKCNIDDYPNVDMDWSLTVTYEVCIYLN